MRRPQLQHDLFAPASLPARRGQWPTEQLNNLLTGAIEWEAATHAIQSWAAFYIHEAAVEVLALPDKTARQLALSNIPQKIRHRVEAEALRLWKLG